MNKSIIIIGLLVLIVGFFGWSKAAQNTGEDLIARNGIHWHPTLTVYVNDKKQSLPGNIGLMGGHQPIHTHTEDSEEGVLHFEFSGVVRPTDLRLGNFFDSWGKDFMTGFGKLERMMVNGEENTEYEAYEVQREDAIDLYYVTDAVE